jgi:glucosamine-phosphate N-acetyltransferase
MRVRIRELTGRDLTRGFLETLAALAEVGLTPEQAAEVLRSRLRSGVRTYVACAGEEVVGTATLLVEHKFIHGGGRVGHIEDVAVRRDCQEHGVGSALVRHATEEARGLGCYKVILDCFEHLVAYYGRLGYRCHNTGMRQDLTIDTGGEGSLAGAAAGCVASTGP